MQPDGSGLRVDEAQRPKIGEGYRRVGVWSSAPAILRDLGADPDEVAAAAGLDPTALCDPDGRIPFSAMGRYAQACLAYTHCQHFGLLVGEKGAPETFGLLGRLMRHATTLRVALSDLSGHYARFVPGAVVYLLRLRDEAYFGYSVYEPGMLAVDQISACALAQNCRMLRDLAGFEPSGVLIAHAPPTELTSLEYYRRCFGPGVTFNAEMYAVIFPARELARPIHGADPAERSRIERIIQRYWLGPPPSLADTVLRKLIPFISWGKVSLQQLAEGLEMHPRTLERRLRAEGTSFAAIREAARYEVAQQLLAATRIGVGQIGTTLGYSDTAAFTRAFCRWSGTTPTGWRRKAAYNELVASGHAAGHRRACQNLVQSMTD